MSLLRKGVDQMEKKCWCAATVSQSFATFTRITRIACFSIVLAPFASPKLCGPKADSHHEHQLDS